MKKEYEFPKAEKVEFNYSEVVVASGVICKSGYTTKHEDTGVVHCNSHSWEEEEWNGDNLH